ncbi:DEAD/DEAH box helicase [Larkinella humicola]|uniref:DEAD/DEAH box helicase n=1 Tax=Larkinella humicola TaxID=2607654 RepID=A0A5N1J6B0_9BACT|nr:DEAD/DEAH box helicase [Larkinella humicola]KAA9346230.1 DEAD/DEAH box helicase [Larkinella humicola]
MKFSDFGFDDRLMEGIDAMNYDTPTLVQEQVIPLILAGKDLIVSAQTGTGKTASYLLPILHKITSAGPDDQIKALVIVPTRELAIQIAQNLEGFSYFTSVSSIAVYGGGDGASYSTERQALAGGADIVICTPGRMISHLNMGYAKIDQLQYLILDEADRMLDMGFHGDIVKIISFLPAKRQSLLLSATMPPKIRELARKILHNPEEITLALSKPPAKIVQEAFVVYQKQKIALVKYLLKEHNFPSVLIFCSRKENVKQLARELKQAGFAAEAIHSDLEQNEREQVLLAYRSRKLKILVATDILSRGIDIDNIDLVINYDVPHDGEDYVHRIGRTARAETTGIAYTFISETEQRKFAAIERLLGMPVTKVSMPAHLGETLEYNPAKSAAFPQRKKRTGPRKGPSNRPKGGGGRSERPA